MSSSSKAPYLKEVICSVFASVRPSPQSRWWTCPSPPEVPSCPLIAPHSPLFSLSGKHCSASCFYRSGYACSAVVAQSLSCVQLLRPHGLLPVHGVFPGKNTGVGCHFLPGDLPDPGIEPSSLTSPALQADSFTD